MNIRMQRIIPLALVAVLFSFGPLKGEPEGASVQGRYRGLIQKVHCPGDKEQYGQFYDYGWWSAPIYCGRRVSSGWWVYLHPFWYVWRANREMPRTDEKKADVGGKYGGLIMTLICPQDREEYGPFKDWGWWGAGAPYCGQKTKPGYWVFRYPYWYVWRHLNL